MGQVIGQSDIVYDEAPGLALRHTVHTGDGLQQVMFTQALTDIYDLFNRRVKASQQHVAHNQEGNAREVLIRIIEVKGFAEVLHCIPALGLHAGLRDDREFIRRVG